MNYCTVSATDSRLFGFKMNTPIDMTFVGTDSSGASYRFVRPSGFPRVSMTKNGLYVLADRRTIQCYDITRANIMQTPVAPLKIGEDIFYLVRNNNNRQNDQYIVTAGGRLLRLSIKNGQVNSEDTGQRVSAADTVVAGDANVWVLSANKTANSRRDETIQVKSCNSAETFTVMLRSGQLTVK
jgi:hypothetical protein